MLKTYVIGGNKSLIQSLMPRFNEFGFDVVGHLDFSDGKAASKRLPNSAQVLIVIKDMVNHSFSSNYVKEAKKRGIYHLCLPSKTP